ncbi:MAG: hypothetical protein A2X40_05510 [Elusimicrobia bacterium GWC2_65_9]|nr:MAG: hypothetical protein A2X37_02210 [Elusimicrobia bacterium GWA2_66_18]OGR71780.1 MAG: hypothetical protein A2X40_05510 [Elusimicrobia bacterium GWC2_65_9]
MRTLLLLSALLLPRAVRAARPEPLMTVEARAVRPGEILLVSVDGQDPKTPPEATFQDRALDFFPGSSTGTWLAFLGLDLETPAGPAALHAVLRDAGRRATRQTLTLNVEPAAFPVQELQVAQKFVTPPKTDSERAESEAVKLHKLFVRGEEKRLFEGRFDSPIPGAASSRFGERRIFNGQPRAPHSGMDLKARLGTPVRAPAAGRVVLADSLFFQGKTIILDHGLGLTTLYAHLSRIQVKPGDLVKKGQIIGKVGATGRATGPHLHWALKYKAARVDPFSLAFLDLDARLKSHAPDPLKRSPACERADLPPAPPWGKTSGGLRARTRPLQTSYARGGIVSMLVEFQNVSKKNAFLDLVLDPALRATTLGFNRAPQPYTTLASSMTARLSVTQVKIPPGKTLCFEQDRDAGGPLLASGTSYELVYGTEFLYASTAAARAGIWRGRLVSRPAKIAITTASATAP